MGKRKILLVIFLSLLYLFMGISCQSVIENNQTFKIYFLDTMETFKGNSYEEIQTKINQLDLDEAVMTITSPDIEAYFWEDQKIILTEEATIRLGDLSNNENCILTHSGELDQYSKVWCAIFKLEDKVFVITLNDYR